MSILYIWKNRLKKFIDNPKSIIPFFKKRLYYNHIADKQLSHYTEFKYLNYEETFDELINNDRSLVRFGDELFDMLLGIGLYFGDWHQKYDPGLAKKLKEILWSRDPKLLIAFNPEFILKTREQFKLEGIPEQFHFWTHSKIFLKNYYHKDVWYGSALCFNPNFNKHIDYEKLKNHFSKKHIIIVASNIIRFKDMTLGITTTILECPKSDSWDKYNEIKESLLSIVKDKNLNSSKLLILISMSSAGKVLVYELTKLGYIAWDTGQFFDLASKEIDRISKSSA